MKIIVLHFALLTGGSLFTASAQVSVNINIGNQPLWGPVGYNDVAYYYLPDIDAYYNVPQRKFIYLQGKNWIFSNSLPAVYGNFDLFNRYKVVINIPRPYLNHAVYYKKYYGYRGRRGQPFIRDCHQEKYWQIKNHPEHGKWKQDDDHNKRGNKNNRGYNRNDRENDRSRGHDKKEGHRDH